MKKNSAIHIMFCSDINARSYWRALHIGLDHHVQWTKRGLAYFDKVDKLYLNYELARGRKDICDILSYSYESIDDIPNNHYAFVYIPNANIDIINAVVTKSVNVVATMPFSTPGDLIPYETSVSRAIEAINQQIQKPMRQFKVLGNIPAAGHEIYNKDQILYLLF